MSEGEGSRRRCAWRGEGGISWGGIWVFEEGVASLRRGAECEMVEHRRLTLVVFPLEMERGVIVEASGFLVLTRLSVDAFNLVACTEIAGGGEVEIRRTEYWNLLLLYGFHRQALLRTSRTA